MGTIQRLEAMNSESRGGMQLDSRSAIFLDRDGTLNKHNGYIVSREELELTPWALKLVNQLRGEFDLLGLITNQPVISRGHLDYAGMWDLNNHLETLLDLKLDFIEFCPHHPDSGFLGEIVELKIRCSCRKPNPGMILEAAETLNIDLENSVLIGDQERDVLAGHAAGIRSLFLLGKESALPGVISFASLSELLLRDDFLVF